MSRVAEAAADRPPLDGRVGRRGGHRWVWVPLAIFALSRVVSTVLLLLAGPNQEAMPGGARIFPDDPTVEELLTSWDAGWYELIATEGYPTQLPRVDGAVVQSQWAFYPLAPGLARLVMLTGLDFVWAASIVSMVTSAVACVVLYDLLRQRGGAFTASLGVATIVLGPVGLVFQTPYSDGPAMLLVLLALRALGRRRWGAVAGYGVLLAFTRPVTLALAAVCALTWVVLWWRRGTEPFPTRDRLALGATTVVVGASFVGWPIVAGVVTGEADAYRLTQATWLHDDGSWTTWLSGGFGSGPAAAGTVVALVVLGFVGWIAARRDADLWPREARLWAVLYTLYILAATRPTPSVVRYLTLALFPFWPLPELSARCDTSRKRLALAVPAIAVCILAQWWWTSRVWVPRGEDHYTP